MRACSAAAAGTLPRAANRMMSQAIMTGRLRRRSMTGPTGSAIAAAASPEIPVSSDTSKAGARKTSTATIGRALAPTPLPTALTT